MTIGPSCKDNPFFDWFALERIPRVGPLTMARLFDAFGSPRVAMEANADKIGRKAGLNERLARTIADLEQAEHIAAHHLLEAIQYRSLDRRLF